MAQGRRQAQPRARKSTAQEAQQGSRQKGDEEQQRNQRNREPHRHRERAGEPRGNARQRKQDDGSRDPLHATPLPALGKRHLRLRLHLAAQHQARFHVTDIEQWRQAEEQRSEHAGAQPGEARAYRQAERGLDRQQLRCQQRNRPLHTKACHHAHQTAGQPEEQRLQKIDTQNVRRSSPNGFHGGQNVHPLLQMRAHGHGDTDRAQHHRDQTDQAQHAARPIQTLRQRGIRFAKIRHLRLRKNLLHLRAQILHIG
jgi:hypothetical protein